MEDKYRGGKVKKKGGKRKLDRTSEEEGTEIKWKVRNNRGISKWEDGPRGKENDDGKTILQTGDIRVAYRWEGKNEERKIGKEEGT